MEKEPEIETEPTTPVKRIDVEYGDIIQLISPSNTEYHEGTFFVNYVDESKTVLINISSKESVTLNIRKDTGGFTDESILKVYLLDRSHESGYARQKGLLPRTWVDVYFKGLPTITGEITDLEEDQIEITTYPQLKIIYIDFAYRGLPEHIPIEQFVIREKPHALRNISTLKKLREDVAGIENVDLDALEAEEPKQEFLPTGESIIYMPEGAEPEPNIYDELQKQYVRAKPSGILFGDYLDAVEQFVEIPESQRRYGIDTQIASYMDELLATVPYANRTAKLMNNIHILVERYRELREMYSTYDSTGNIRGLKRHDATTHKPLVDHMLNMDVKLNWLIPTVVHSPKHYEFTIPDALKIDYELFAEEDMKSDTFYKNKSNVSHNKYANMMSQINAYATPYDLLENREYYLKTLPVGCFTEAFVSNLPNMYSETIKIDGADGQMSVSRFVRQTYTMPMTRLIMEKHEGKKVYIPTNITEPDQMTVKSMIMMPLPVMLYSRVGLPGTNIMEKSQLGQISFYGFRLFNKRTVIDTVNVSDLTKEIEHMINPEDELAKRLETEEKLGAEEGEGVELGAEEPIRKLDIEKPTKQNEEYEFSYLTKITEYVLDSELVDTEDKFKKYLQVILPKTRVLIRLLRKYISGCYSFVDVVNLLEPFMVYESDITYKQYMEIRYLVKEQVRLLKEELGEKTAKYNEYKNAIYSTNQRKSYPSLYNIFETNELKQHFASSYGFGNVNIDEVNLMKMFNNSEIITRVGALDGGDLFVKLLMSVMSSLITPKSLIEPIDETLRLSQGDEGSEDHLTWGDCTKRILTKKYQTMEELEKDNGTEEIYFDKDFDETPYKIAKKYEKEKKEMEPKKFAAYLAENLIQKHDCPRDKADALAKLIIEGKRKVVDGEYAVLEIKPKLKSGNDTETMSQSEKESLESEIEVTTKYHYYIRRKNAWVLDDSVESTEFVPSNKLFCNLKPGCFKGDSVDKTCNTKPEQTNMLQYLEKKRALKEVETEFERRFQNSREEMRENMNLMVANKIRHIIRLNILKQIQLEKTNHLAYAIGETMNKSEEEIIKSPYEKLKNMILGQKEFVERQLNIVRFCEEFCREPMVENRDEDPYWKYCEKTNAKLIPAFLYSLAKAYTSFGPEEYERTLQKIISTQGVEEDGIIYDKYSDEIIYKVEYVTEDAYNEQGFRVITNSVLEKDPGSAIMDRLTKKQHIPVFENELAERIYVVYSAIVDNIADFSDSIRDQVLRLSAEILEKELPDQEAYENKRKKMEKDTGKKVLPFNTMRNKKVIQTVSALMLISAQTAIPSYKSAKTFPGCIVSFDGYPMTGEENIRGIEYFACLVNGISSEDIEPWNSVAKIPTSMLAKQQVEYIKKLMENPTIFALYENKKIYLELTPDEVIPLEHNVENWRHFMPPLFDINVKVNPVSSTFVQEFWSLARKGHKDQTNHIHVIESKTANYGQYIIECIQKIVSKKELALKTAARVPYIQNSCCSDKPKPNNDMAERDSSHMTDSHHPMRYFILQESNSPILHAIKITAELSKTLNRIHLASVAPILTFPITYKSFISVSSNVLEENIYAAMIRYCGLDRGEIPEEMRGFFSEVPEKYNPKKELMEKVQLLKEIKRFGLEEYYELMRIVNRRNLVSVHQGVEPKLLDRFSDMIRQVEEYDQQHSLNKKIRENLRDIIAGYVPNRYYSNDQEDLQEIKNLDRLKNELVKANEYLFRYVQKFLQKNANLSKTDMRKTEEFISNLHVWKTDSIYDILQFFRCAMYDLTKYFPGVLSMENEDVSPSIRVHHYWNLSYPDEKHIKVEIDKYESELDEYKNDETLAALMRKTQPILTDLFNFFNEMPVFSTLMKDREYFQLFDRATVQMLCQHMLLSGLYYYTQTVDNIDIKQIERKMQLSLRQKRIDERADPMEGNFAVEEMPVGVDADEYTDAYNDLTEVQLDVGKMDELSKRMGGFIMVFLNRYRTNKKNNDFSYDEISNRMLNNRTKEKERIMKGFKDLEDKGRKAVEYTKKKLSLGKWSVGMQKGIFKYDKKTSDRERAENLEQGIMDLEDEVPLGSFTDADLETDVEKEAMREEQAEMFDFSMGSESYMDGVVYDEDREPDELF